MERKRKVYHKTYQTERMQDPLEHGRAADAAKVVHASQEEWKSDRITVVHERCVHNYYHATFIFSLSQISPWTWSRG